MVRMLPPTPERADLGLREIIASALAGGAAEPAWIAIDDGSGQWLPVVAACPATERARGVVVASGDGALLAAHRLGVAGAAVLPLSTPGLVEALRAVSKGPVPVVSFDPAAMELFEGSLGLKVAAFSNRAFWRAQLGDRVLTRLLAELAIGLGLPPLVLPWPALLLSDRNQRQILEAWKPLAAAPGRPADDLVISDVVPGERGVAAAVYSVVLERAEHLRAVKTVATEPVYELPAGRLIGRWASEPGPEDPDVWVAAPIEISGSKCRWRLTGGGTNTEVGDILEVADLTRIEGAAAVRVPGSVTGNLRPGSPAGLLVQRLADAAARRGFPIWVPNVDTEALRLALRLPGTVWVDGPAVPR
ncbi:MAG: hypothetical protein MUP13_00150 [Thermoanaerobaculales bacterium]|nr:hypothetical protein [Thermoanaerobaculales bacterium]